MTPLYPEQEPYESGFLSVGDGHKLAFKRYGNRLGKPVVYLHGGPGAGTSWEYQLFNPDHFNILLFDQRGAGASLPSGGVRNNSMDTLVADIEAFRKLTGVETWSVAGGSFGSTLGLRYAIQYPERAKRMLLRGIYFGDRVGARHIIEESGTATKNGNTLFDTYQDLIPEEERTQGLMLPYYERLFCRSHAEAVEAARRFDRWDTAIATYKPRQDWLDSIDKNPEASLALARLFFYYAVHHFRDSNRAYIFENKDKLKMPIAIIHGRNDHICPVQNAVDLHHICEDSTLKIVERCGHVVQEPGLQEAFLSVTNAWLRSDEAGASRPRTARNPNPACPPKF